MKCVGVFLGGGGMKGDEKEKDADKGHCGADYLLRMAAEDKDRLNNFVRSLTERRRGDKGVASG